MEGKSREDERRGVLKYIRFLVLVAGVGACIQAIVWICMTITGIVIYTICAETVDGSYGSVIRTMYFTDPSCFGEPAVKLYMQSQDLLIWECVILALMVLWFLASILLIGGVREDDLKPHCTIYLILWSTLTLIISVIDLAVAIFFGLDSTYVLDLSNGALVLMSTVSGVMMTVALRGFVLWTLNVASSIYFIAGVVEINAVEAENKETQHSSLARGPLSAYDSTIEQRSTHWLADAEHMDRPKIQNPPAPRAFGSTQGEINHGYVPSLDSPTINNRYQQQQPLASIMKKSIARNSEDRYSSPQQQQQQQRPREYNIPSPDYSPPQLRKTPYRQQMSADTAYANYYGNSSSINNNNNRNNSSASRF